MHGTCIIKASLKAIHHQYYIISCITKEKEDSREEILYYLHCKEGGGRLQRSSANICIVHCNIAQRITCIARRRRRIAEICSRRRNVTKCPMRGCTPELPPAMKMMAEEEKRCPCLGDYLQWMVGDKERKKL